MIDKIPLGIKSCSNNGERRVAIAETWLKKLDHNKFFPVFLIGRPNEPNELIDNILYLDCEDHYQGLSGKMKQFYKWALDNTSATHFWTVDDDSYINCNLFNNYNTYVDYDYCGNFIYGMDKCNNGGGYTSGCGTCISRNAAKLCYEYLPRTASDDDTSIGNILYEYMLNIKKLDITNILPWSYCRYIPDLMIGHYVHKGEGSLDTFNNSMHKMHSLYYTKTKPLLFDIGANRGDFTKKSIHLYDKIICIEPNPELIPYLNKQFAQYENKIIIDRRGVSDTIGEKIFMISSTDTISTFSQKWINQSRFAKDYTWEKHIIIDVTTLDAIVDQYGIPDFIKIDVEGYELEVISGLSRSLIGTTISFEWTEENYYELQKIIEKLKQLNFNRFSFIYGDAYKLNEEIIWSTWENLDLHNDIDINRKDRWGTIYAKV